MNAETIKKDSGTIADELCRMIAEVKCSPLSIADETLNTPDLNDTAKAQILYALVMAAQVIAEEAFRVAALAALGLIGPDGRCPCEACKAARNREEGTLQ